MMRLHVRVFVGGVAEAVRSCGAPFAAAGVEDRAP
jgi:hypothetical protein